MLAVPPAVIVVPLASKEQVYQTVNYVVGRLRQIEAPLRHVHSDAPSTWRAASGKTARRSASTYI